MYRIVNIENYETIGLTDDPRFVKINPETGVWIRCNAADAQCIAVNCIRYSLIGREPVEDAPIVVLVQQVDSGEVMSNADARISSQNADIDTLAWGLNKMASEIVEKFSFKTEES